MDQLLYAHPNVPVLIKILRATIILFQEFIDVGRERLIGRCKEG
jgi:hypothetical protein